MPDQMGDNMVLTVHERVGITEQEIHTLKHRISKVEDLDPRVAEAERNIEAIGFTMSHLQERQQELRDDVKHGFSEVHGKFDAVNDKFDAISEKIDIGFRELREAVNVGHGRRHGFSRALQTVVLLVGIVSAGTGAVIWYSEFRPAESVDVVGMAAKCKDGSYSTSEGRGACSGHGGVARWLPEN